MWIRVWSYVNLQKVMTIWEVKNITNKKEGIYISRYNIKIYVYKYVIQWSHASDISSKI